MSTFANVADMRARFEEPDLVQLTDVDGVGVVDEDKVEVKLASADALIIGYIAARYRDVNTFAGNTILKDVACDYAFSLLWKTDLPKWVEDRRKLALDTLSRIANGSIKLDQGTEEAQPRPGQILTSGPERRFTRDSLSGY